MNVSVCDIGSNTAKVLIAKKNLAGQLVRVAEKSFPCRLGAGLSSKLPVITPLMIEETLNVLGRLFSFSYGFSPVKTRVVATEALRRLSNANALIERVRECYDETIEILSGKEEAFYVAKGLMTDSNLSSIDEFCAIDLGGGSMEIVRVENGNCTEKLSLPLGSVVLSEKFLGDLNKKPEAGNIKELQSHISSTLSTLCPPSMEKCSRLVGTGGSIIFLRQLLSSSNQVNLNNYPFLIRTEIKQIADEINSLDLVQRISKFPDLPSDRADVFPSALLVILELLKFWKLTGLNHSFHNLRYGVAEELLTSPRMG